MDFDELNRILELVRQHELSEFELERDGFRVKIKKGGLLHEQVSAAPRAPALPAHVGVTTAPVAAGASGAVAAGASRSAELDLAVVKSPIVGTFFRASEPGAPPFVQVGDVVKKGQALCIIEAMKLMNEIDSEYDGEIVSIYVENGQPVQRAIRNTSLRPSDTLPA